MRFQLQGKRGFSYRGKGVSVTGEKRFDWLEAPVLEGRLAQRPQEGARGPKRLCLRRCRRGRGLRRKPRRKPLRRLPASFPRPDVEFMYFTIMSLLQGHLTSSTRADEVHCRYLYREQEKNKLIWESVHPFGVFVAQVVADCWHCNLKVEFVSSIQCDMCVLFFATFLFATLLLHIILVIMWSDGDSLNVACLALVKGIHYHLIDRVLANGIPCFMKMSEFNSNGARGYLWIYEHLTIVVPS